MSVNEPRARDESETDSASDIPRITTLAVSFVKVIVLAVVLVISAFFSAVLNWQGIVSIPAFNLTNEEDLQRLDLA